MIITSIKRIIKSAIVSSWRNRFVALSSILVLSTTLFVFGSLIFSRAALDSTLNQIKEKVDINVYFVSSAPEQDILDLKESLELLPEVKSVEYLSREKALENFKEKHKDDQLTLQALEELPDNPLGAILNIQANETSQYESIAKFLDKRSTLESGETSIIDKVNFYQNKIVIDRLTKIISATEKIGFTIAFILVLMSIIITFNTIRLAIYISREEISVMRLVGASNKYVRGPFIVEGILHGAISALITLIIFAPITYYVGPFAEKLFGLNLFSYYLSNFVFIFALIFLSGILLGIISSYLAVRKYLKV